jgi:hypothetical protein
MTRREQDEQRKQARFLKRVDRSESTKTAARKTKSSDDELERWFNNRKFLKRFVEARARVQIRKDAVYYFKILPEVKKNVLRALARYAKTLSEKKRRSFVKEVLIYVIRNDDEKKRFFACLRRIKPRASAQVRVSLKKAVFIGARAKNNKN